MIRAEQFSQCRRRMAAPGKHLSDLGQAPGFDHLGALGVLPRQEGFRIGGHGGIELVAIEYIIERDADVVVAHQIEHILYVATKRSVLAGCAGDEHVSGRGRHNRPLLNANALQTARRARRHEWQDPLPALQLPPLCPVAVTAYDFSQTVDLIHRSEAATRLWLKQNGLRDRGTPSELLPHEHAEHEAHTHLDH